MVGKEDLYTSKINCKGKTTVGKASKGINVEKNNNRFKKLKIKIKNKTKQTQNKKRKTPQNCKSQCKGRSL